MVQDTETLTDTFANIGGTYRAWIMANPERQVVSTTAAVDGASVYLIITYLRLP